MLAVPGIRERLATRPVVAVSPLVGGRALKGPAAKMMAELGLQARAPAVARPYRGHVNGFVTATADAAYAHPYFWAPFFLVGDSAPLRPRGAT